MGTKQEIALLLNFEYVQSIAVIKVTATPSIYIYIYIYIYEVIAVHIV